MQTFGESNMARNEKGKERIIHASLQNDTLSFMASDSHPDQTVQFGDNIHMSIVGSDEVQLRGYFEKLSEGGKIDMPLAKQFWGDTFGQLTDKFGIHWMVNIASGKQKK